SRPRRRRAPGGDARARRDRGQPHDRRRWPAHLPCHPGQADSRGGGLMPTEQELRSATTSTRPEPPAEVLDRLEGMGHDRNGFCEACWREAGRRAVSQPEKPQTEHYLEILGDAEAIAAQSKEITQ